MNLEFSEEQRMFADALGRYLHKEYAFEHRAMVVAASAWGSVDIWAGLAELGCYMLVVPEASGGLGGGAVDLGIMARALGAHLVIEPVRAAVMSAVLLAGAEATEAVIETLMTGERRYAVADPALAVGGSVLAPGGGGAEWILIAEDDLAAVPCEGAFRPIRLLDDSFAAMSADVPPPTERFRPGLDWDRTVAQARAYGQVFLCFEALGSIEASVAATAAYVRERRQFGKAIADFQVVQHRVAEMVLAAKEAEAACLLAALTLDARGPSLAADRALAAAIHVVTGAAESVANAAVQLHGGMGVSDELSISAHFRKLQAFRLLAGSVAPVAEQVVAAGLHRRSAVLWEA